MVKNELSLTEFLRNLKVDKPAIWFCPTNLAQPEMKKFTSLVTRNFKFRITQKKALLVTDNAIPQTVIIVTRRLD